MPGTPDLLGKSAAASVYHLISAASTNAAVVKASAGLVTGYYIVNTNTTTFRYVKLYNKATSPTVGTDTPRVVLGIPPVSAANVSLELPLAFETGIGIATTTGIADSDSTAVAASELAVSLYYL